MAHSEWYILYGTQCVWYTLYGYIVCGIQCRLHNVWYIVYDSVWYTVYCT